MTKDTRVAKHLSEFNKIIGQLSSVDVYFDDEIQTLILESWNGTLTALSASAMKKKCDCMT